MHTRVSIEVFSCRTRQQPSAHHGSRAEHPPLSDLLHMSCPSGIGIGAVLYPTCCRVSAGIEEAKKRDHRNVGVQQDLFFFHHLSPGSAFFLPHGGRIYNTLIDLMREKYWEYEYEEVREVGGA